jgi:hypothetical protein
MWKDFEEIVWKGGLDNQWSTKGSPQGQGRMETNADRNKYSISRF